MAADATVGILRVLLTGSSAEFEAMMKKSADSAKAWQKDLKDVGRQATELGSALTKTLTVPLVGLAGTSIKAAMDFESSFAGVRKTVKATDAEFAIMAQGFRDLAKTIPVNVNELNRLGEAAGALGIPKAEVVDFARVMALLGVTTNVTSDQAAESIAKIQNSFGAAGKETQNFASTLVALGNDGASTEAEILSMATRIAGAGNAIGMTQGQVLAFASALSSVGIEAEMGGSAISRVFIDIASAVSKGGDEIALFAKVAGQPVEEFSRLFREDAASAVEAFINGLGRVKTGGGDLLKTLEELGFTEIRVRDTLLRTAGAGDLLSKALKLQGEAWRANSALTTEAAERFKTTESQLALLWNRVKDVGITLGNALLPAINQAIALLGNLMPLIDSLARGFGALPVPIQTIAIGMVGVVAAAGPAIWLFGQLAMSASAVAGAFAAKGLAAKALGTALAAVSVPVVAIGTAIGGLAVIWANFKDDWTRAFDVIIPPLGMFRQWLDYVRETLAPHQQLISDIASIVRDVFTIAFIEARKALAEVATALVDLKDRALVPLIEVWDNTRVAVGLFAKEISTILLGAIQQFLPSLAMLVFLQDKLKGASGDAQLGISLLASEMRKAADEARKAAQPSELVAKSLAQFTPLATSAAVAFKKTGEATKDLADELKQAQSKIASLTSEQRANISASIAMGDSTKETVEAVNKLWPALKLTEREVELYKDKLKLSTAASKEATEEAEKAKKKQDELAEFIRKTNRELDMSGEKWSDFTAKLEESTGRIGAAIVSNALIGKNAQLELDALIRERTMSRLMFELDALHRHGENEKIAIDRSVEGWERAGDAIDALTAEKMATLILSAEEVRSVFAQLSLLFPQLQGLVGTFGDSIGAADTKTKTWRDSIGELANSFATMAQVSGGALSGFAEAIGQTFAALDIGLKAGEKFIEGFTQVFSKDALKKNLGAGLANLATGLVGGFGALMNATSSESVLKNAIGGAITGAAVGASIGAAIASAAGTGMATAGIWGAAAGAIVGIFIGVFRGRDTRRLMEQVGEEWGGDISKGMAEKIKKSAKDLFGGNREAAAIFNLSGLLGELGGLNDLNFDKMASKLRDVFVMVDRGLFTTAQAAHVLDENWAAFVAAGTDGSGRISESLREIIRLNDVMGTQSKEIAEFLQGQGTAAMEGFNAVAATLPTVWGDIAKRVEDARENLEKLHKEGGKSVEAVQARVAAEQEFTDALRVQISEGKRNSDQLADMGVIAVATFAAAIASGQDFATALRTASPGLTSLQNAYSALGLRIEDAGLQSLILQNNILTRNPQLIAGIGGLSQSFIALSNMGLLNVETFEAMQRTGLQMYTRLQAETANLGGSARDALIPMQGFLQEAAEQARLLGIPLDANTQMLIDQSKEFGIWRDKGKSANDIMLDGFQSIVDKMQELIDMLAGRLVGALNGIPGAARNAGGAIVDEFGRAEQAARDLGDVIAQEVIQQHSPTGLEGIVTYAGYAADAMRDMARAGSSAMHTLGSAIFKSVGLTADLSAAFKRITTSNVGRALSNVVSSLRSLDMQDVGATIGGMKGMGSGLLEKVQGLSRAVQLAGKEGFSKDLLGLRFQMGDEIGDLGPDPAMYRKKWTAARDALQLQLGYQLEDLEMAREDQIHSLGELPDEQEKQYAKATAKIQKQLDKQLRSIEESRKRDLENLDDVVDYYDGSYEAATDAVTREYDEMAMEARDRADQEIESLGPIPQEYRAIYEEALKQIETYYARMKERTEEKNAAELELLGVVPDEYDQIYGKALDLVKAKYAAMVEAAAKAAKETVDAWAIVGEMFGAIVAANPNIIPPAPGGGAGPGMIGIDAAKEQVNALFMAKRGTPATADELAKLSNFIDYKGESHIPMALLEQALQAVRDYLASAIPQLATGGIVSAPTLAMLGERGPEAVVPLGDYNQRDDALLKKFDKFAEDAARDRAAAARDRALMPHHIAIQARAAAQIGSGRRR